MFEDTSHVFGLAPGIEFPKAIVAGLRNRLAGQSPDALARVTLWVNSAGMRRRIIAALTADGPVLLPRIRLVTDLAEAFPLPGLPPADPPLRRRLILAQMISALLDRDPTLAPRMAVQDLSQSLARLMDEMAGEGVSPETVAALDVSQHSDHWARTQRFLQIATAYFGPDLTRDVEGRRRNIAERLAQHWAASPPTGPQIVVGSTGSRGATALLMQAVAALPQGALVLPGFDFDMPAEVWRGLDDAMTAEDHPQYRYRLLLDRLNLPASAVQPWHDLPPPAPARNRLVSLSLRPAPVTDQWLTEGPGLGDMPNACAGLTLLEAPSPRSEALSIALVLRAALARGQTAGLMTPDRGLARQVTAALDRWNILPDDSAGRPLPLTPQGRLLRLVSELVSQRIASDHLMALLKNPMVHSGAARGQHLRLTRELELHLRHHGPAFLGPDAIRGFAKGRDDAQHWAEWLCQCLDGLTGPAPAHLADHLARHLALVETLANGSEGGAAAPLWTDDPGREARKIIDALLAEAGSGGDMSPRDYADLFASVLTGAQVRDNALSNPALTIWGTREAREHRPDIMIIGGLNDGTWPALPPPDPWMNRQMRLKAGLLLPERQIGLMAHDYQQAIAAPQVVLSRAIRSDEAETTASRWLNRLVNLVTGLPGQHGPQALDQMRARGQVWLDLARQIDTPTEQIDPAPRPAPAPPLAARPRSLSVTAIERLIRDPYYIYAQRVLRLRPLDPLRLSPDARLRGSVVHAVMERYARSGPHPDKRAARAAFEGAAQVELANQVPWPAARILMQQRLMRMIDWFLDLEQTIGGEPVVLEQGGAAQITPTPFTLTARPDRIDLLPNGRVHIFDYKTGTPPTQKQLQHFDKQLLLTAALVTRGGFADLPLAEVHGASYIGLGSTPKQESVKVAAEDIDRACKELDALIAAYLDEARGYPSRRAPKHVAFAGDYDHLARHGEWEDSDAPQTLPVGRGTHDT